MRENLSSPITNLEPDPRQEGTVRLVIEGRAVLTVPAESARSEGLEIGTVLSAEQLSRLERAADHQAAFRTAVRLLARRPYARADLARRLKLKGHVPDAIAVALDRAEQAGYLDDERFARHYVESRSARGRGPARLRIELAQMGVSGQLIDAALATEGADRTVEAQIDRLVAKRVPLVASLAPAVARQRLLAYLARRGFRGDMVRKKVMAAVPGTGFAGGLVRRGSSRGPGRGRPIDEG